MTQDDGSGKPRFLSFTMPRTLVFGDKAPAFLPRKNQSMTGETFDEIIQAGTDGVLVDLQGHAVYYSQYLDHTFVTFVRRNGLTDPDTARHFNPKEPWPIGAKELKVSWKIVNPGEDTSGFFTTKAQIARLTYDANGHIVADPSHPRAVTLALVGFHVAGVVKGHPEMIWATFEHKDNAPDVPHQGLSPNTIVSQRNWTFYRAGTPYRACNVNAAGNLTLNEETQTLSPVTEVCRVYAEGTDPGSTDPKDVKNRKAIRELNRSVHGQLKDVWANYFEVGAIWFKDGPKLAPDESLATDDLLTGSLKLSNSTIETFTQTQSTMNNCFRCHNTVQQFPPRAGLVALPGLDLNISHAFVNIFFWSQEKKKELPAAPKK
ncbi:MAG: hypothetical protein D6740_06200 [Alphaproteobacteria bacterium]|nr:MAG: hypothetical protein D6740_06200 [Alphaproteobacteria bacterium]